MDFSVCLLYYLMLRCDGRNPYVIALTIRVLLIINVIQLLEKRICQRRIVRELLVILFLCS